MVPAVSHLDAPFREDVSVRFAHRAGSIVPAVAALWSVGSVVALVRHSAPLAADYFRASLAHPPLAPEVQERGWQEQ